jgi:hypothetical protein
MALIKGRFIDPTEAINLDLDPVIPSEVTRKSYVDTKSEQEAAAALSAAEDYADAGLALKQDNLGTGTLTQYLRGDLTWQEVITSYKENKTITATDISNGYVDLIREAMPKSMIVSISGTVQYEDEDYTLSNVNGVTRITFTGDLAPGVEDSGIVEGDKLYFQYWAPLEN